MFDRKTPCVNHPLATAGRPGSRPGLRLVSRKRPQQAPREDSCAAAMHDAVTEIAAADARAKRRETSPRSNSPVAKAHHCRVSFVVGYDMIDKLAHLSAQLSDGDDEPTIAELLDLALDHLSGSLSAGRS